MDIVGHSAQNMEERNVNKKLGQLIHPGVGIYFSVMAFFCLCAVVMEYTLLAVVEIVVTVVLFAL